MQGVVKLYQTEDIHELAEMISTYLEKAIVIDNDQFELVAYSSPNTHSFDPVQQKTILAKRCPLYVIERLKKEGIIDRLAKNNQPIRKERMDDIGFYERVVLGLKHNGHVYGYLWVYEAEQVKDEELTLLADIASHLGKCLYKQRQEEANQKQGLIWRLMNDDYLNEAEIFQLAKKADYQLPKAFTVVVYSVQDTAFVHVLEKIKTVFVQQGYSYYLGKGTEIIGIIHAADRDGAHTKAEDLIQIVAKNVEQTELAYLFVGIGGAYHQMPAIRKSYLEALEVIETMVFLNGTEQNVVYFHELGMYRYVKLMYKKNVSEQYRNSKLLTLMQHDTENNSTLLKTLWYFLQYDAKVARTAEALFIHPNTLNYRMRQITDLTSVDLTDTAEKMELYSQLMLIHLVSDYRHFYMNGVKNKKMNLN